MGSGSKVPDSVVGDAYRGRKQVPMRAAGEGLNNDIATVG